MTVWYLARATGMVALIAFTASTVLGALSTRRGALDPAALDRRLLVQLAHRSAAIVGLAMLLTHVTLILVDAYVEVSPTSVFVPFTAGYRPLALGLGTFAVYAFLLAGASGALRGRAAGSEKVVRRWRVVHLAAYAGWALAMGHGILAGTDTGSLWSTGIYVVCGVAVATALWLRLATTPAPLDRAGRHPLARSTS